MNLARKKQCLQVPADGSTGSPQGAKPVDWPAGWEFPPVSAWPPGYPKAAKFDVAVEGAYLAIRKALAVRCMDKFAEDTDVLMGQSFQVKAVSGDKLVRMRQNDQEPWSEYGIFLVAEFQPGRFGLYIDLELEPGEGDVDIQVLLFGYDNCGTMITVTRQNG